jgi:hypothetical protein
LRLEKNPFFPEPHFGSGMSVRSLVTMLSCIDLFDQRLQS